MGPIQSLYTHLNMLCAGVLLLSACAVPPSSHTPDGAQLHLQQILAQQTQSSIDAAYTATADAELGDISTQVAIQHSIELALSSQMTQQAVSLEATQVAATLTADQAESTATAQAQAAGTAQALDRATTTTQAQQTATHIGYAQATSTGIAVQTEVAYATQQEHRRDNWQTFWRVFWAGTAAATVTAFFILLFRFIPWIQLKYLGIQNWNGKPITAIPDGKGNVFLGDISRSLGPGLVIDAEARNISSHGGHENNELQASVTARAQAAELLLAASNGNGRPAQRQALAHKAFQATDSQAQRPYQILSADHAPPLLTDEPETVDILDAEWRDLDES